MSFFKRKSTAPPPDAQAPGELSAKAIDARVINLVFALTDISDVSQVFTAYPDGNPANVHVAAQAAHLGQVQDYARDCDATVVLLDHRMSAGPEAGVLLGTLIQNLRHNPERPIITVGVAYTPEWTKTFEALGTLGTIQGPITEAEIQKLTYMLPGLVNTAYLERQSPHYVNQITDDTFRRMDSTGWQRQTLNFWSSKGGVGKSFIAKELAVALGVLADLRVLLIDGDQSGGVLSTTLGLRPAHGGLFGMAASFLPNANTLSPATVSQYLTPYYLGKRITNLKVITGLPRMALAGDPAFLRDRGAALSQAMAETINRMPFDFVIWDMGLNFHTPMHLHPLRKADRTYVVTTCEMSTNVKLAADIADLKSELHIDNARLGLIINKFDPTLGITAAKIIEHAGIPQVARIPKELNNECGMADNFHEPLMLKAPSPVSEAIAGLAMSLFPPFRDIWGKRGGAVPAQKRSFTFLRKPAGAARSALA